MGLALRMPTASFLDVTLYCHAKLPLHTLQLIKFAYTGSSDHICGGLGASCDDVHLCVHDCGTDSICGGNSASCSNNNDSLCHQRVCNHMTQECQTPEMDGLCGEDADCPSDVYCSLLNFTCGGLEAPVGGCGTTV